MVHAAYGDEELRRSNIFSWYRRFCEGRQDVQDDTRCGHPSESRSASNVENIRQLLLQNRHLSLRMIADELDISKNTVRKTVVEDLKNKESLLVFCIARIDCKTGGSSCYMSRFD